MKDYGSTETNQNSVKHSSISVRNHNFCFHRPLYLFFLLCCTATAITIYNYSKKNEEKLENFVEYERPSYGYTPSEPSTTVIKGGSYHQFAGEFEECVNDKSILECCVNTDKPVLGGLDVISTVTSPNAELIYGVKDLSYDLDTSFGTFKFWFSTLAAKQKFSKDPWHYAPAFGGFDAAEFCQNIQFSAMNGLDATGPYWNIPSEGGPNDGARMWLYSNEKDRDGLGSRTALSSCAKYWVDAFGDQDGIFNSECFMSNKKQSLAHQDLKNPQHQESVTQDKNVHYIHGLEESVYNTILLTIQTSGDLTSNLGREPTLEEFRAYKRFKSQIMVQNPEFITENSSAEEEQNIPDDDLEVHHVKDLSDVVYKAVYKAITTGVPVQDLVGRDLTFVEAKAMNRIRNMMSDGRWNYDENGRYTDIQTAVFAPATIAKNLPVVVVSSPTSLTDLTEDGIPLEVVSVEGAAQPMSQISGGAEANSSPYTTIYQQTSPDSTHTVSQQPQASFPQIVHQQSQVEFQQSEVDSQENTANMRTGNLPPETLIFHPRASAQAAGSLEAVSQPLEEPSQESIVNVYETSNAQAAPAIDSPSTETPQENDANAIANLESSTAASPGSIMSLQPDNEAQKEDISAEDLIEMQAEIKSFTDGSEVVAVGMPKRPTSLFSAVLDAIPLPEIELDADESLSSDLDKVNEMPSYDEHATLVDNSEFNVGDASATAVSVDENNVEHSAVSGEELEEEGLKHDAEVASLDDRALPSGENEFSADFSADSSAHPSSQLSSRTASKVSVYSDSIAAPQDLALLESMELEHAKEIDEKADTLEDNTTGASPDDGLKIDESAVENSDQTSTVAEFDSDSKDSSPAVVVAEFIKLAVPDHLVATAEMLNDDLTYNEGESDIFDLKLPVTPKMGLNENEVQKSITDELHVSVATDETIESLPSPFAPKQVLRNAYEEQTIIQEKESAVPSKQGVEDIINNFKDIVATKDETALLSSNIKADEPPSKQSERQNLVAASNEGKKTAESEPFTPEHSDMKSEKDPTIYEGKKPDTIQSKSGPLSGEELGDLAKSFISGGVFNADIKSADLSSIDPASMHATQGDTAVTSDKKRKQNLKTTSSNSKAKEKITESEKREENKEIEESDDFVPPPAPKKKGVWSSVKSAFGFK